MIQAKHNQSTRSPILSSATAIPIRRLGLSARQWLWLLLLLSAVILFPERPAWGMAFDVIVESGGCFITASASEFSGLGILMGLCLITTLYGLRLVLKSTKSNKNSK